ncbi:hypothetical protein [uncultured Flavobacterium sp.]|uniref:hypothetical protein n=1 Tax=uncultured Flavobacterium sp. TaxID=165435 RepID=UPI0030EEFF37|tara:strand:+ start:29687 stop:30442 length:756 start_codon:yes stop_codon:yes gene_type:complete
MAKVTAPFNIIGTIDGLNFYSANDQNYVRKVPETGITKEQFRDNPVYDHIKKHGTEFGNCSSKSRVFRLLAKQFYDQAKEGSFAGRVNGLLFDVLGEDSNNEHGKRTVVNGLKTEKGVELLIDFEANKLCPLDKTFNGEIDFNWDTLDLNIKSINPEKDINWPQTEANVVHIQLAIANWNFEEDTSETKYSNLITFGKEDVQQPVNWDIETPAEKDLWLAFICISFGNKIRRKTKPVHKKFNTATILSYSS